MCASFFILHYHQPRFLHKIRQAEIQLLIAEKCKVEKDEQALVRLKIDLCQIPKQKIDVVSFLPDECPIHCRTVVQAVKVNLTRAGLSFVAPCSTIFNPRENSKRLLKSSLSPSGENIHHRREQQKRHASRAEDRKQKATITEEENRCARTAAGLFLCHARSEDTGHYCRKDYLDENARDKHESQNTRHHFPYGVNSKDRLVLMAAVPGGHLAFGSRPNKMAGIGLHTAVVSSEPGAIGAEDAVCYGKFHRPKDKQSYHKPAALVEQLKRIFSLRPIVNEIKAYAMLKEMIDPDPAAGGGLMFCWSKRGEVKKVRENKC